MVRNGLDFQLLLLSDPAKSGHSPSRDPGTRSYQSGNLESGLNMNRRKRDRWCAHCSAVNSPIFVRKICG